MMVEIVGPPDSGKRALAEALGGELIDKSEYTGCIPYIQIHSPGLIAVYRAMFGEDEVHIYLRMDEETRNKYRWVRSSQLSPHLTITLPNATPVEELRKYIADQAAEFYN